MTDRILSPHFTLMELTTTDRAEFQEKNRNVTIEQIGKLQLVAELLEQCRQILGCLLEVHSGYRCPELNVAVGSTERSQHLKAEAADFSPLGPDSEESIRAAFNRIALAAINDRDIKFGQLIFETQTDRFQGRKFWLHISLGVPYRPIEKCGQIAYSREGKFSQVARA